jgi:hypothetical protein
MLRAWNQHWANYEYMGASSHVRAGWIYHDEGDLVAGREPRIARLSHDGVTDVLQELSWLDVEISAFLDGTRFPRTVTHPNIPQPALIAIEAQQQPPNLVHDTHVQQQRPVENNTRSTPPSSDGMAANETMETDSSDGTDSAPVAALISQVERMSTIC